MQEKIVIKFDGNISTDLRDIAFATTKISKILNRAGYAITSSKEKLDHQQFQLQAKIEKGSLIIDIAIFLSSLYPEMFSYSLKETFVKVLEFAKILSGLYEQIETEQSANIVQEIKNEEGNMTVILGNNNSFNINIPEPVYRTAMASDKEISAINKKILDGEIKALQVDKDIKMDASTAPDIQKGLQVIDYLKNMPIEEIHKAEIEVYEYNKKKFTGKAYLKNTDLFGIKKGKTIDFYFTNITIESELIKSLQENKTLLVDYKPIISDMVEFKELKKIEIISVDKILNI